MDERQHPSNGFAGNSTPPCSGDNLVFGNISSEGEVDDEIIAVTYPMAWRRPENEAGEEDEEDEEDDDGEEDEAGEEDADYTYYSDSSEYSSTLSDCSLTLSPLELSSEDEENALVVKPMGHTYN